LPFARRLWRFVTDGFTACPAAWSADRSFDRSLVGSLVSVFAPVDWMSG
jgi:hypothetical protein